MTEPFPDLRCHHDGRRWSCELLSDWTLHLPRLAGRDDYHFATERPGLFCTRWLELDESGRLTILSGYASDGCTWAPDFPRALPGCLLHDALRQASSLDPANCPWTRHEADLLFREQMRLHHFPFLLRWLYYLAVAGPTGWIFSKLSTLFSPPLDRACRL